MVQIPQNVGGNMPDFGFRQKANIQSNTPKISNPFGSAFDTAGSLLNVVGEGIDFITEKRNEANQYKAQNHLRRNISILEENFKKEYKGADASTPEAQQRFKEAYSQLKDAYLNGTKVIKEGLLSGIDDNVILVSKSNAFDFEKFADNSYTALFDKQVNYTASELEKVRIAEYDANMKENALGVVNSGLTIAVMDAYLNNIDDGSKTFYKGMPDNIQKEASFQIKKEAIINAYTNELSKNAKNAVNCFFSEKHKKYTDFFSPEEKAKYIESSKKVLLVEYAQSIADKMIRNEPFDFLESSFVSSGLFKPHEKGDASSELISTALKMKNVISYYDREASIRTDNNMFVYSRQTQRENEVLKKAGAEEKPVSIQTEQQEEMYKLIKQDEADREEKKALNAKKEDKSDAEKNKMLFDALFLRKMEINEKEREESAEREGVFAVLRYNIATEKPNARGLLENQDYKNLSPEQMEELNDILEKRIKFDNYVEIYNKNNGVEAFDKKINKTAEDMHLTNKKDWEANRKELLAETKMILMQEPKNEITDSDIQMALSRAGLMLLSYSEEDPDRKMLDDLLSSAANPKGKEKKLPPAKVLWKVIDDSDIKEAQKEIVYGYLVSGQRLNALRVLKNGKR